MSEAVRGLVIAHSSLAGGLVAAARQITGADEEALRALSNEGQGPAGLIEALSRELGDAPAILFTDLPSGSCAFAARKVSADRPATALVTGVNLAILIDFVFHREMPLPQLVERLVEKGRAGVTGAYREGSAHADRALSG
jgi:mannose/fructose-specific phosphotransferase system component IIA